MTPEQLDKLNEGRQLRLAMPVLMPILARKRDSLLQKLIGEFRIGVEPGKLYATVAEISAQDELIRSLERSKRETEQLEGVLHNEQTNR